MENKSIFYFKVALAIAAFVVAVLSQKSLMGGMYGLMGSAIYVVFILSAALTLTKTLMFEKEIKVDTLALP